MSERLIAYFSPTGNTKKLAEKLANAIEGDLFEIVPEKPYTKEDLDWLDRSSRSSLEMSNRGFRPDVLNKVEDISKYDIIYLGFPIWWYGAPNIVNSFLEEYDLKGKTIIPFATSGGSEMEDTNEGLAPSCKGAILKDGDVISEDLSEEELKEWAKKVEA